MLAGPKNSFCNITINLPPYPLVVYHFSSQREYDDFIIFSSVRTVIKEQ